MDLKIRKVKKVRKVGKARNVRMINKKILALVIVGICVCAGVVVLHLVGGGGSSNNLETLYVTASDATLKAEYYIENQWSDVKIRFEYKKVSSNVWNYTDWQEISENVENGTAYEDISNLTPSTRYEFKTILQHDSGMISSPVSRFETHAISLNYEAYGTVDYTVDGDTIKVTLTWVNPSTVGVYTGSNQSVRFSGGIDAPEWYMDGGEESKYFVRNNFCPPRAEVFLDLDNLSDTPYHDSLGRLLGVIYVKKDGKWVNVNAELLRWGQEMYPSHNWLIYRFYRSEFNPDEWLEADYPYVL